MKEARRTRREISFFLPPPPGTFPDLQFAQASGFCVASVIKLQTHGRNENITDETYIFVQKEILFPPSGERPPRKRVFATQILNETERKETKDTLRFAQRLLSKSPAQIGNRPYVPLCSREIAACPLKNSTRREGDSRVYSTRRCRQITGINLDRLKTEIRCLLGEYVHRVPGGQLGR